MQLLSIHTPTFFFHNCNDFYQHLFICATIFFRKIFAVLCGMCKGLCRHNIIVRSTHSPISFQKVMFSVSFSLVAVKSVRIVPVREF